MRGKIINNSQPSFRDVQYVGMCPIHSKDAIVTIGYSGIQMCKTDLKKLIVNVEENAICL